MAQKFNSLEEAAQQLGISKDRLSQLREAGKVRGYRDGASWKFRSDDIDKIASEGIPTIDPPPSDIDLGSGLNLDMNVGGAAGDSAASSGLDLSLAGDDSLPSAAASDLNLDEIDEPTVPIAAGDDSDEVLSLDPDEDLLNLSDSILLSEKELGGAGHRPPSTIIGKAELDPDGDLDLTLRGDSESTALSDVKLAATSDVLSGGDDDSLDLEPPNLSDNFQGLAEVDVDLEAESSRILSPGDADKVKSAQKKGAAKAQPAKGKPALESSDLKLAASDSNAGLASSDIGLAGGSGVKSGLTGLSALELEDDDDQVLGEGSDITLSSESSGINIISPSDSGLALDEVALSSASMSSPLDLGGAGGDEALLEPLELSDDDMEGEEPFQLTPLSETDEEKDSSQIIALDDITEEETAGVAFHPEGESGMLGEDFAAVGLTPGMAPVAVATTEDIAFPGWVLGFLSCSVVLLLLCGMMMFDLVRNIWSWDEVTTLNSKLLEVLNPLSKS
jgi:excisionase family DNA binding protein